MQKPTFTIRILLFGLALSTLTINAQNNLKGSGDMNKQIIQNFVDTINEHNVDKLCSLMTEGHKFIDSQAMKLLVKKK